MPPTDRKRLRRGARLPHYDHALIDPAKLKDYALNPEKDPGKANGCAALGFGRDDWEALRDAILAGLPDAEATHADLSDIIRFTVRIPVVGPNGRSGTLITGWCIDMGRQPWLSTLIPKPDRRS